MAPMNPNDPNSPLSWTERILKTSNKIDRATTGALFAATGASAVIGMVDGKRAISKAQAKSLGEFFKVSPDLFV